MALFNGLSDNFFEYLMYQELTELRPDRSSNQDE